MLTFSVKNFDRFQHYKDRAPPWIKLYNELLDDYDFGRLTDASKFHLIAIWLLASRSENKLPFDPAWIARRINAVSKVNLDELVEAGFIVTNQELQKSEQDASAPLAKCLSREREEKEVETEKKDIRSVAKATRPDEDFEKFKKDYPRRLGSNPWQPAKKLFNAALKADVPLEAILLAVRAYRQECEKLKIIGTSSVAQAMTWLRQERYSDYISQGRALESVTSRNALKVHVASGTEAWNAWCKHAGKSFPLDSRGGWLFDSEYPPGYEPRKSAPVEGNYIPPPQVRSMQ